MNGRLLRATALATGVLTLVAFAVAAYLVNTEGFPDGHLTEYERASRLPRLLVCAMGAASSVALLGTAARREANLRRITTVALLVVFLMALHQFGIPFWFLDVQGLENGGGG